MKKTGRLFLGFLFVVLIIGCTEPSVRTDSSPSSGADLPRYRRVAIVDFQIMSGSDRAPFLLHDALLKELRKRNYDVLGRIETNRKIKQFGISTGFADLSGNARHIGNILEVDAIIGGTVSSVPLSDEEIFYNVTVSMAMMDAANGFTLWFGSGSCRDGTLKGCAKRIARGSLKDFPKARRKR
jgi:hypothetical protein